MMTTLGKGGRFVIPAKYRKILGLKPGDELILELEDGELKILNRSQAIKRAQALVRLYVPENRSLSEELIKERREEAARE